MKKQTPISLALLFLAVWGLYLQSLNPVFRADDSPETVASCVTLGIQHPPGYPLHTLVGRLASLVPVATPAFRLNLMAAAFAAAAAVATAAIVMLWVGGSAGLWVGLFSGAVLAAAPGWWTQALAAKGGIYTFHAFQFACLLLLLTLWDRDVAKRRERPQSSRLRLLASPYFLMAVLCFFVGFGNHWETQALFVPALAAWAWFFFRDMNIDKKLGQGRGLYSPLLIAGGLAVLGLSVYLYLPLRAAHEPVMNWGAPKTYKQFMWVLLRQEYLDLEVGFLKSLKAVLLGAGNWAEVRANWELVQRQGLRVLGHLLGLHADLGFPAALLSVAGAYALWAQKQRRQLALLLTLLAAFAFIVTFYFHLKAEMVWILDAFLLPPYLVQAVLAGLGLHFAVQRLQAPARLLPAALLLPLGLAATRLPAISQRQHYLAYDYGKNFLLSMKRNAIVFAEGDFNTMPIYYLQQVQHARPDVTHLTTIFLSIDWGVEQLKLHHPELGVSLVPRPLANERVGDGAMLSAVMNEIIAKNRASRPIQSSLFRQVQSEQLASAEPLLSPAGLSVELDAPDTAAQWARRVNLPKAMTRRFLPEDQSWSEPSPAFALSNYGTMYMDLANYMRNHGKGAEAMAVYATAVANTTRPNLAEAYTHWGIALGGLGRLDEASAKFKQALEVKPLFEAAANLASTLNQQKRYAEGESFARQAIALKPNSPEAWNNLAIALYYTGKQQAALQALEEAFRYNPNDPSISANLRALKGGH